MYHMPGPVCDTGRDNLFWVCEYTNKTFLFFLPKGMFLMRHDVYGAQ